MASVDYNGVTAAQKRQKRPSGQRAEQGIGASAIGSINVTLIGDLFAGRQRTTAMGFNASVLSIGTAAYPAVVGALALVAWSAPFALAWSVTASVAAPPEPLAAAGESGVGEADAAQSAAVEATAERAPAEGRALASIEADALEAPATPAAEPALETAVAAQDPEAASEAAAPEAAELESAAPDVAAGPDEGSPSLFRRVTRGTRDKLRGLWPN